jgi:hypothetical protein
VGAGVGVGLTLDEEAEARELEARFERRGFTLADARRYDAVETDRDRYASLAIGLGIAAGAAAVTGLLLWWLDTPALPTAAQAEALPLSDRAPTDGAPAEVAP